jgi:hypothetical protein
MEQICVLLDRLSSSFVLLLLCCIGNDVQASASLHVHHDSYRRTPSLKLTILGRRSSSCSLFDIASRQPDRKRRTEQSPDPLIPRPNYEESPNTSGRVIAFNLLDLKRNFFDHNLVTLIMGATVFGLAVRQQLLPISTSSRHANTTRSSWRQAPLTTYISRHSRITYDTNTDSLS